MRKKTTEEFIIELKKIYGNRFDYSKIVYTDFHSKVCLVCPEHGEFWQYPKHLLKGISCQKCSRELLSKKKRMQLDEFIKKAKEVHGDKYDYSKVEYINNSTQVCIICPEHGEFWQTPMVHLAGHGCRKCFSEKISKIYAKKIECYVEQAREVHGNKYDYSKINYINNHTDICIICPEHGEFWQNPSNHLHGDGCPKCSQSSLENEISLLLDRNGIEYEHNKRYSFLDNLQLDFYIPSLKIAIECQGKQHFKPVAFYGGESAFVRRQYLDKKKLELCKKNNILLLYYSNLHENYPYNVIEDKKILMEILQKETSNRTNL